MSCVIGVPEPCRMHRPRVFVTLNPGVLANDNTRKAIMDYAAKHIAKYAMPKKLEFRESPPKTLVDKVAYRQLVEEKTAKRKAAGE